MSKIQNYQIILNGVSHTFKKERTESFPQFSLRVETFINAIENGYDMSHALMLSSIECNKVKYVYNKYYVYTIYI